VIAVHTLAGIVAHIARVGPQSSEAAPTQEVAMKKESREHRRMNDGAPQRVVRAAAAHREARLPLPEVNDEDGGRRDERRRSR
jgi:hypothetical protein